MVRPFLTQSLTNLQRLVLALPERNAWQPPLLLVEVIIVLICAAIDLITEGIPPPPPNVDILAPPITAAVAQTFRLQTVLTKLVDDFVVGGVAVDVKGVGGVVMVVVVGEELVEAEDVVVTPIWGGAVAASRVEDVAARGGWGQASDDGGRSGRMFQARF